MIILSTGERMLTCSEAQERYSVSYTGLLQMLKRLQVTMVRMGRNKYVSEAAVEDAIRREAATRVERNAGGEA